MFFRSCDNLVERESFNFTHNAENQLVLLNLVPLDHGINHAHIATLGDHPLPPSPAKMIHCSINRRLNSLIISRQLNQNKLCNAPQPFPSPNDFMIIMALYDR